MQELERQFKADGGTFEEYKIGDLFSCRTGDVDVQRKHLNGKGQIYINSGVTNLGIIGRTDYPAKVFPSNTITVDMFGNSYFRDFEYKMATHAHVFSLNFLPCSLKDSVGLYICAQMKYFTNLFSFSNMCNWTKMKGMIINLPTMDGEISFPYMESVIRELQDERISKLAEYLRESGLENTELSQEEKNAVLRLREENVNQGIFFQGQIFDAYAKFQSFISQAQKEIILIDNYVDLSVLERLATKNSGVNVTIYTQPNTRLTAQDIRSFNAQYPTLTVKHTSQMHDRFLIIDNSILYHVGASLKDLGKKCFAFDLFDASFIPDILAKVI